MLRQHHLPRACDAQHPHIHIVLCTQCLHDRLTLKGGLGMGGTPFIAHILRLHVSWRCLYGLTLFVVMRRYAVMFTFMFTWFVHVVQPRCKESCGPESMAMTSQAYHQLIQGGALV